MAEGGEEFPSADPHSENPSSHSNAAFQDPEDEEKLIESFSAMLNEHREYGPVAKLLLDNTAVTNKNIDTSKEEGWSQRKPENTNTEKISKPHVKPSATLSEGDSAHLSIKNSEVYVVGGDHIQGNKIVHKIYLNSGKTDTQRHDASKTFPSNTDEEYSDNGPVGEEFSKEKPVKPGILKRIKAILKGNISDTITEKPEEENSLMSSWKGNSPGYNVPEYGWRIALSHKFPPKKRTAWMLPFKYYNHAHLGLAHRYLPFHKRLKKINRRPCIDYFDQQIFEQIYGVPAGGIGGGCFNRGWRGEFCRWQLRPGIYENVTSSANQFIVCIRRNEETVYQKVLSPDSCLQNDLKSWVWDFPADQAFYHALYPRAWTVYEIPRLGLVLTCRQISPVIPHEYKDSSLPAVVFSWHIQNNSDRHYQVTIALAMENGIGTKDARLAKGNYNQQFDSDENCTGVTMHNTYFEKMPYTMTLGGRQADDKKVSKCLNFDPLSDGSFLWNDLFKDGDFDCADTISNRTVSGQALGCALAIRSSVNAKSTAGGLDFVLSWDMPVVYFGSKEFSYRRRYTRYYGSDGNAGHKIAIYALNNYRNWEEQIERWQKPILSNSNLPNWYKSALFNQLYYITDGGTIWLEIAKADVSSDNQAQNSSSSITKEYLRNSSIIQEYGRFAYLEGHEYRMFNTYDSHFHASIALAHLWPNLELSLQYDIAASILQTDDTSFQFLMDGNTGLVKSPDVVPHDLGDPEDEPWQRVNAYFIHDTAYWMDLNPKFVLQVFRDYYITKNMEFLKDMWPVCLKVMVTSMKYDSDGDGLIENNGTADQTFYWWSMSGPSAYCGGLWLGALRCILQAGKILDRENEVKQFEEILKIAAKSYQDKLWNGNYFNYCSDRSTKHWDSIMADQCVAQWYLLACDIADVLPPEQVTSSLKTIYEFNVQAFGVGKRGAVNGMRPNREIDQSCMQSQEVWSGVTYALAATMIHKDMVDEAFKTAEGMYKTIWEDLGMAFQTPAAILKHNHYRSLGYMRSLSIWGMQCALERISEPSDHTNVTNAEFETTSPENG